MKIIISLLLVIYGITFYLALHPKVSEQHYNYYIANTTDLTKVDTDRMTHLKLDHSVSADTNQIFFDRWIHPRPGVRLSNGNHPAIIFSLDHAEINLCKCVLELTFTPLWPQPIEISINGHHRFDQVVSESKTIQIALDRGDLKAGLNYITFNLTSAKKLRFSDKSKSAIEFSSMALH